MKNSIFLASLICVFPCFRTAYANEVRIPFELGSGIKLGQGFDMESMEWRQVCVSGRLLASPPQTAEVEAMEELGSVYALEQMSGELSSGISLPGGIASVKAKTSVFSTWTESKNSSSSMFRVNFGKSSWELKDLVPLRPLAPDQTFHRDCGTHVVIQLEADNDLRLFLKFMSHEESWLQKMRTTIKMKAAGGLVKKKWTIESLKEGADAQAVIKVGVLATGYFRTLLNARLSTQELLNLECRYPSLENCIRLNTYFEDTITYVRDHFKNVRTGRDYLMDTEMVSAAVLIPYETASPLFASVKSRGDLSNKVFFLAKLKRTLYELWAVKNDMTSLGENEGLSELDQKIVNLEKSIQTCERKNKCI
ncbi:MAG: hypothetical protein EOP04_03095 [Proteobacteria bacterium]|nr:MAG: hypothetical protein EOP04_03095 [Pseudomonadota bacterium]